MPPARSEARISGEPAIGSSIATSEPDSKISGPTPNVEQGGVVVGSPETRVQTDSSTNKADEVFLVFWKNTSRILLILTFLGLAAVTGVAIQNLTTKKQTSENLDSKLLCRFLSLNLT